MNTIKSVVSLGRLSNVALEPAYVCGHLLSLLGTLINISELRGWDEEMY